MISTLRTFAVVLAGGLTVMIGWAASSANFFNSFAAVTADPWGLVALADLYLGFLILSVVIWLSEPDRKVALMWIVPIFFLGNVVSALWLMVKLPQLAQLRRA